MSRPKKDTNLGVIIRGLNRAVLRMVPLVPAPELYDLVVNLQKLQTDLDQQVEEAIAALQKSTELVNQLEDGVKERAKKLNELRAEYKRYSELAQIESDKASALIAQLEQTVGRGKTKERWIAFAINILAGLIIFFAGVLLNEPVENAIDKVRSSIGGDSSVQQQDLDISQFQILRL